MISVVQFLEIDPVLYKFEYGKSFLKNRKCYDHELICEKGIFTCLWLFLALLLVCLGYPSPVIGHSLISNVDLANRVRYPAKKAEYCQISGI